MLEERLMEGGEGVKANYLKKDLGLQVGYPPWEVFLRDPSPYLR